MTTENPNFVLRHLPVLGGLSGVAAFCTIFWSYALLPTRVAQIEEVNKGQSADIIEMRNNDTQRREVLAVAMATLAQINDRTKRIEDHLMQPTTGK